jgi:putative ubiquitin-RnfH superfamily antitoxin RatB of RatAB toxin-antitoxin module
MAPADTGVMSIEVVFCSKPGVADLVQLALVPGAMVSDALRLSGLLERHALQMEGLRVGVWGKARELSSLLRDRDRVEIYRPLTVDPKEARRQRYRRTRSAAAA